MVFATDREKRNKQRNTTIPTSVQMVIDNGEGDRDIHTWEKITNYVQMVFATDRCKFFKPTSVQT